MTLSWNVLIAEALGQGWRVVRTTPHILLQGPEGAIVCISSTPSDQRAINHCFADLRRGGLRWQGRYTPAKERPPASTPTEEVTAAPPLQWAESPEHAVYATIVDADGPLTTTEICDRTGRPRTAVRAALDSLVETGSVVRCGSTPRDKRRVGPDHLYAAASSARDEAA